MEPLYNRVLGTMKITLPHQASRYIRAKNKETQRAGTSKTTLLQEGPVISDLFITRLHCIIVYNCRSIYLKNLIHINRGVGTSVRDLKTIWKAWIDVLSNALIVWKGGGAVVKHKKVWNLDKTGTLTSLYIHVPNKNETHHVKDACC